MKYKPIATRLRINMGKREEGGTHKMFLVSPACAAASEGSALVKK